MDRKGWLVVLGVLGTLVTLFGFLTDKFSVQQAWRAVHGAARSRDSEPPPPSSPVPTQTISATWKDAWLDHLEKTLKRNHIRVLSVLPVVARFEYSNVDPLTESEKERIVRRFRANFERQLQAAIGSTVSVHFEPDGADAALTVDATWWFERAYSNSPAWKLELKGMVLRGDNPTPLWLGYLSPKGFDRMEQTLYFEYR